MKIHKLRTLPFDDLTKSLREGAEKNKQGASFRTLQVYSWIDKNRINISEFLEYIADKKNYLNEIEHDLEHADTRGLAAASDGATGGAVSASAGGAARSTGRSPLLFNASVSTKRTSDERDDSASKKFDCAIM